MNTDPDSDFYGAEYSQTPHIVRRWVDLQRRVAEAEVVVTEQVDDAISAQAVEGSKLSLLTEDGERISGCP
ncbi:hypothetical protein [Candidatus Poriferisocius sp.]|uniref:hypothetical protein n=1 Tax=Candidatus Poriferisocius sp. TaxID=3101276 RepID=UPI003B02E207